LALPHVLGISWQNFLTQKPRDAKWQRDWGLPVFCDLSQVFFEDVVQGAASHSCFSNGFVGIIVWLGVVVSAHRVVRKKGKTEGKKGFHRDVVGFFPSEKWEKFQGWLKSFLFPRFLLA
jgi:hypothetical protein